MTLKVELLQTASSSRTCVTTAHKYGRHQIGFVEGLIGPANENIQFNHITDTNNKIEDNKQSKT